MSDYYDVTGAPAANSFGASATIRAEFQAIEDGLTAKLPALTGNALKVWRVNSGATAVEGITTATLASALLGESWSTDDATNAGVTNTLTIGHTTTGTPTAGIGTGFAFSTETANGNNETGMVLEAVTTDVSPGSEDFDLVVKLMAAGAAAAEAFRVSSAGVLTLQGALNTTNGGSMTGTWSDMGTVTTIDINGGTLDGVTIGGSSPGAVTGSTVTTSSADINGGAIDGTTIGGTAAADGTFNTLTANTSLVSGAAAITGGTINGTVIGGVTPAAVTTSSLVATTADINAGTVDATIGGTTPAAGTFTTLTANTSLALATGATVTGINDTDNMSDASATTLATSESIKAYVDAGAGSSTLSALTDTNITTPGDAALILYDTGTAKWRDANMSGDATIDDLGALTIGNDKIVTAKILDSNVTYAKIQDVTATSRILGRITVGAGVVEELTGTQATSLLDDFSTSSTTSGLTPGSNSLGAGYYLNGSGTWTVPAGSGDVVSTGGLEQFATNSTTPTELIDIMTATTGTGDLVFATSPALTTPDIGVPSAGDLQNCTALPISTGVSGLGTNVATFLATPSSANLASAVTGETGSGALVFGTSPTIATPDLTLKTGTTPTAEGDIEWHATNNTILVGDGAGTKTFSDDSVMQSTYAPINNPTFTGTITIGSAGINETELEILDGALISTLELNLLNGVSTIGDALTTGGLDQFGANSTTSAQLATVMTNETGSGLLVFGTSPTIATPDLTLKTGTAPTAEGDIEWHATNNTILVGSGGATKVFSADADLTFTEGQISDLGTTVAMVADNLSVFASTTSAQLASIISNETGSGLLVFGTDPVLTTPQIDLKLGTVPTSNGRMEWHNTNKTLLVGDGAATKTFSSDADINITESQISNLGTTVALSADKLSDFAATTSAELKTVISDETGSGSLVFANSPALVTPDIGTPSAGSLGSCDGLPISTGVTGLGTNVATFLGTPSSANLALAVTGETGTGALVFGTSPSITTPTFVTSITIGSAAITEAELERLDGITEGTVAASKVVTADSGGDVDFSLGQIKQAEMLDYAVHTNAIGGTGGGTQDIDLSLGNSVSATVDTSENTFTFSNPTLTDEECSFVLYLTNGASQTTNWPASVDWQGGTEPSLTVSGVDILAFSTIDGGTTWHGRAISLDSKTPA